MTNIDQRRMQDDFVASIISKAREGNTDNLMVGRTVDFVSLNSVITSIKVDFNYFSTVPSMATCKLLGWSKEALKGKPVGQKVLVGKVGNFYAILDIILE